MGYGVVRLQNTATYGGFGGEGFQHLVVLESTDQPVEAEAKVMKSLLNGTYVTDAGGGKVNAEQRGPGPSSH
jgi:hypothetical protein